MRLFGTPRSGKAGRAHRESSTRIDRGIGQGLLESSSGEPVVVKKSESTQLRMTIGVVFLDETV